MKSCNVFSKESVIEGTFESHFYNASFYKRLMTETATKKKAPQVEIAQPITIPKDLPFSSDELKRFYRLMLVSRRLDQKMLIMVKQGKSFFHIGGSGHEGAQLAAAMAFTPGKDWAYPYYRDLCFTLGWGVTPDEILMTFFGRADDPSGGMPTTTAVPPSPRSRIAVSVVVVRPIASKA